MILRLPDDAALADCILRLVIISGRLRGDWKMVSSDLRLSQALGVTPTKSMSRMIDLIETFVAASV